MLGQIIQNPSTNYQNVGSFASPANSIPMGSNALLSNVVNNSNLAMFTVPDKATNSIYVDGKKLIFFPLLMITLLGVPIDATEREVARM